MLITKIKTQTPEVRPLIRQSWSKETGLDLSFKDLWSECGQRPYATKPKEVKRKHRKDQNIEKHC